MELHLYMDLLPQKDFFGKGYSYEMDSANYQIPANSDNVALDPTKTFFIDTSKTTNRSRYLPNAGTYGIGRVLYFTNGGNDFDAAIYPYSGQYINGFLGSSHHITLTDMHDCCTLITVSATAWVILSIRGSF